MELLLGFNEFCGPPKCKEGVKIKYERTVETNIEKYGTYSPMNVGEIKLKYERTMIELYGVSHPFKSKELKEKGFEKAKETLKRNHGVENVFQLESVKQKIGETNLERYGDESVMRVEEIKERGRRTNLERRGVPNSMQCPEVLEKNIASRNRYKKMKLPSGNIINYMGYENVAIRKLLEDYNEAEIITNRFDIPEIWWIDGDKKRRYFPDIWIPSKNLIIEVKSTWTYSNHIEEIEKKGYACRELGYNFEIWICSDTEILQIL